MNKKSTCNWQFIFLGFLVPLLIMTFVMMVMQIAPFGQFDVLVSDCDAQYIDRITGFRNMIFEGKSYLYTWSQIQGSTPFAFIGVDPFYVLYLLVPDKNVVDMVTLVIILKIALSGATAAYYFKFTFRRNDLSVSIFAWCYALMGYAVAYHFLLSFENSVIILPLILLGVEKILRNKKNYGYLATFLTISFIMDYYFAYMTGVYAFIYFCYRYVTLNDDYKIRDFIGEFINFMKAPIVALGCSAVVLLPIFSIITSRDGLFEESSLKMYLRYDLAELISKLFIGSYDTVLPNGFPYIYCGMLVLVLIGFYFCSNVVQYKEKLISFIVLLGMVISLSLNPLYVAWQGFKPPVYFEGRFSFLVSFTMIFIAYKGFTQIQVISLQQVHKIFLILMGVFLFVNRKEYEFIKDNSVLYVILFMLAYYLIIALHKKTYYSKKKIILLVAIATAFELESNTVVTLKNLDIQLHYPQKSTYVNAFTQMKEITTDIKASDPNFYRMEFVEKRGMNDGFGVGFPSISHFDSTYNYDVKQMIDRLGVSTGHNWIQYEGTTPIVDTLLNIKYVTTKQKNYFGYEEVGGKEETYIYKNPYAISVGFMVKGDLNDLDEQLDAFELQTTLLNEMLGEKENQYFTELKISDMEKINSEQKVLMKEEDMSRQSEEASLAQVEDKAEDIIDDLYYIRDLNQDAFLSFHTKAVQDGPCFMALKSQAYHVFTVLVNEEICHEYCHDGTETIYLGNYKKGDVINIKLRFDETKFEYHEIKVVQMNENSVKTAFETLNKQKLEITKQAETRLQGHINVLDETGYLFTSIPFDEGWQITVDGKKVSSMPVYGHFLGIKLNKGDHSISFNYMPKGFKEGLLISIGTITMLVIAIIVKNVICNKEYKENIKKS